MTILDPNLIAMRRLAPFTAHRRTNRRARAIARGVATAVIMALCLSAFALPLVAIGWAR